jgi:uncharacterized protein YqgC (DUF456 family)
MTASEPPVQFCYKHPSIETGLRCNRCERPICSACAIHTETGYRCKECIRGQQKIFDTARWYDFVFAINVALCLAAIGSILSNIVGFFVLLLSPLAGIAIAEIVRFVIRKRRNRLLNKLVAGAVFIGSLIPSVPSLLVLFTGFSMGAGSLAFAGYSLLSLLWPAIFAVIAASSCYYRLSGIQLR